MLYVAFLGVPGCRIGMLPAFHAIVPFFKVVISIVVGGSSVRSFL